MAELVTITTRRLAWADELVAISEGFCADCLGPLQLPRMGWDGDTRVQVVFCADETCGTSYMTKVD